MCNTALCSAVELMRESFMMNALNTHQGHPRPIKRVNVYNDVIKMYRENMVNILQEYLFRIHQNE